MAEVKVRMQLYAVTLLLAGTAFGGTIPVTGSGSFVMDNDGNDSNTVISFSGSDGVDSVSFEGDIPSGYSLFTVLSASSTPEHPADPSAPYLVPSVDGLTSNNWTFTIGNGVGNFTLYDPDQEGRGVVLVSQDLSGFIDITSYTENGTRFSASGQFNTDWMASGTFTIGPASASPVPEPGSGVSLGIGLLGAFVLARRASFNRVGTLPVA